MTYSAVPALRAEPALAASGSRCSARVRAGAAAAREKPGTLVGMALTERQGGSDVRANETRAEPGDGGYVLNGHKWFCSAPMCDAFLVLAQAPGGLTCFLLPRVLPDGERNGFHIERLKDKLGNRSNASAEIASWTHGRAGSGRRAAASRRSSRWSSTRGSTASSDRPRSCGARSQRRRTTRRTARCSAAPRRAAAAPERARRPLSRLRGRDRDGASARARGRRGRPAVPAPRDGGGEVLGVQDDAAARRRGARMPRRERLRRGVGAPAALPREPAQLAVGGRRERERARPPARRRPRAREHRSTARRDPNSPQGADPRLDEATGSLDGRARRSGERGVPGAAHRRARRALSPGRRSSSGTRLRRSRMPSARRASGGRADAPTGRFRAASTPARSSSATGPGRR